MSVHERLQRFVRKSPGEKREAVRFRFQQAWRLCLPRVPLPCRLPWGGWWLAQSNDEVSDFVLCGVFESAERRFVERFLAPGMTVIDAGAHHGFYTLLASKKVLSQGRVIAFEPSPRELARLRWHLRLNCCGNVTVEEAALGAEEHETELFIAGGRLSNYNSLRPRPVPVKLLPVRVRVTTVDAFLARQRICSVDFLKLDIEGGDLDALKGAAGLLARSPRPVALCEISETSTGPWGYAPSEIVAFLSQRGYRWFRPRSDGALETLDGEVDWGAAYNFVAVPEERLGTLAPLMVDSGDRGEKRREAPC